MSMFRRTIVSRHLRRAAAQGMVEYGLILAIIALVAVGAMHVVGQNLMNTLADIATELTH